MKVLEENNEHEWCVGEKIRCRCCGSVIELTPLDAQNQRLDNSVIGKVYFVVDVLCPVCNFENELRGP